MQTENQKDLDTARRDFLKKTGKLAVYAPPAMLALMSPSFKAIAQSSGGGDQATPPSGGFEDWVRGFIRRFFR